MNLQTTGHCRGVRAHFRGGLPLATDLNGEVLLALAGVRAPAGGAHHPGAGLAGRVAARILGKADKSTLDALMRTRWPSPHERAIPSPRSSSTAH
ncbi:hypothetical protein QJS66_18975 [Kocuria rhizophila]|nr:hypothetical protein QJS66_18975 [Kocuria rhizophila]